MIWIMLIFFPQTSTLRIKKLGCISLKTTKQWSRWSWREEALLWDMCQELTEFLLIGCLTESIWTPRFKSGTLTPNTRSQTYWQKASSHVMSGTIFSVVFNIIHFISLTSCSTVAKRIQNQKEDERVVSKSQPAVMNISSLLRRALPPHRVRLHLKVRGCRLLRRNPTTGWKIPTHSTQRRLLKCDWRMHTLAGWWEKQRWDPSHQEEEDSEDSDNPAAQNNKAWEQPLAHGASSSVDQESQKNTEATWDHYPHKSLDTSHNMEAVFSMFRKIYGRQPGDPVEDLNVNMAIWRIFMNTTLRAAAHLGKDHDKNLRFVWELFWHKPDQFPRFEVGIDKVIAQSSLSMFHCQSPRLLWLCALLGENGRQSCWILAKANYDYFSELNRIDGQLLELEWKIFPGFNTMAILNESQQMMGKLQCEPENFTGRIIFMSMFNHLVWDAKRNCELCENNSKTIQKYARRFPRGHWSFLESGSEKKWHGKLRF